MFHSVFSFICFQVHTRDLIVTEKESKRNCLCAKDQIQCSQSFRFSVMHDDIIEVVLEQILSNLAEFWKTNLSASLMLSLAVSS